MTHEERVSQLASELRAKQEAEEVVRGRLREFTTSFHAALEATVTELYRQVGGDVNPEIDRKATQAGWDVLSFKWGSGRIIVATIDALVGAAPEFDFFRGPGPFGRIVIFRELVENTAPLPVCEIYVHPGGTFRAHGIGFPVEGDVSAADQVRGFAVTLLENLVRSVTDHHKALRETQLDPKTLEVRARVGFKVTEDEE